MEYLCLYEDISKKVDFRNLGKLKENVEMYVDLYINVTMECMKMS